MTGADLLFWMTPWEPSPVLLALFILVAILYVRGATAFRIWRNVLFWSGFLLLYTVLSTGVDYFAQHLFFVHRAQHVVLHHLAPVLLVLSRPGRAIIRGMPSSVRRLTMVGIQSAPVRRAVGWLNHPLVAPVIFSALTVIWLIPDIHVTAMLSLPLYRLMNLSIGVNGLMFWWSVVSGPWSRAKRITMAIAILPVQVALGLILIFSSRDLYPVYALCGRVAGISAIQDQQIGGALLWLSSTMMGVVVVLYLIWPALIGKKRGGS